MPKPKKPGYVGFVPGKSKKWVVVDKLGYKVTVEAEASVKWKEGTGTVGVEYNPLSKDKKISVTDGPLTISDNGAFSKAASNYRPGPEGFLQDFPSTSKHSLGDDGKNFPTVDLRIGKASATAPLTSVTVTVHTKLDSLHPSAEVVVETEFHKDVPPNGEVTAQLKITMEVEWQAFPKKPPGDPFQPPGVPVDVIVLALIAFGVILGGKPNPSPQPGGGWDPLPA